MSFDRLWAGLLLCLGLQLPVAAADFYVASNASGSGTGSLSNPWKLQTALNQPSAVHPGDTIWLRGGTYSGKLHEQPDGKLGQPDHRAPVRGRARHPRRQRRRRLHAHREWRLDELLGLRGHQLQPRAHRRLELYTGVDVHGPSTKFINMIVHDATGQGFGNWSDASDSEISGCLIYYNGSDQLAHGIYAQNQTGMKWLKDNIVFRNNGFGLHIYTSGGHIDNMHVEGNTSFDTGSLDPSGDLKANILLGASGSDATSCNSSPQVAQNPTVMDNYTYHKRGDGGRELDLGYSVGSCNPAPTGNYLVGDTTLTLAPVFGSVNISGNTFYGPVDGFSQSAYPSNTYLSSRPSGTKVFIRPNAYEAGRAHITVYNWDLLNTVSVDLSSVLSSGSSFEIRNAQDYFASPVVSGVYDGNPVSVPMNGLSVASPVGYPKPSPTGPEFNVFVLTTTLGPGEFFDVPQSNLFHDAIHTIAADGITAGCAAGLYCPDASVLRSEMAVFLLKSEHGSGYTPPAATGNVFDDVSASSFAAAWIERIHAEGITAGCTPNDFCPNAAVSRAEMAVFLLKGSRGSGYVPPPATGTVFSDVPANAFAAAWIEDLAARGYTAGCGNGKYCPGAPVSRAEMAAFLVSTFALP